MNEQEANEILSGIKFLDHSFRMECGQMIISAKAPDTRDRAKINTITHLYVICLDGMESKRLIHIAFDLLIKTLRHEAGELFTIHGICPFDEHSPSQGIKFLDEMFKPKVI